LTDRGRTMAPTPRGDEIERAAPSDELRRDVRELGALLGTVLREQGGDELLAAVEAARRRAIDLRESGRPDLSQLGSLVARLDPGRLSTVARAFATYFHLINLLEQHHRLRSLRARALAESDRPMPESIADAFASVPPNVPVGAAEALVERLAITPVFTAHPTEARRRTVLERLGRLGSLIADRDHPRLTVAEATAVEARILESISVLWQTEEVRPSQPSVLDEVRSVLANVSGSLYEVVPELHRDLRAAFRARYPESSLEPPVFLRFGSWVGGDRSSKTEKAAGVSRRPSEPSLSIFAGGPKASAPRAGGW
jgi:phosphoenolpyruvate carboxylase